MKTFGGRLGCGIMLVITFVASQPFLFAWAWGGAHCEPQPTCRNQNNMSTLMFLAGIITYACVAGFLFRSAVNFAASRTESGGYSLPFMAGSIIAAAAVIGGSLWAGLRLVETLLS